MMGDQAMRSEPADIVDAKLPELRKLCRRFGVRRLDLFGSAATGRFDPARSDLDFLVDFAPSHSGKQYLRFLDELEKLFGRKVDLIDEAVLENPYLRRQIETERRTLFPAAMISNQAATFLWDARRAAERIARFTVGRSFDGYLDEDMVRAAVERQFEVIGEAFAGLQRVDAAVAAQIPDLRQIIGFRNALIHGYATVDDRVVWDVVQDDLPRLLAVLARLLDGTPPP
jgi:uncharacterized protein with HEPN domain/predicted nucleotidyltransferase